MTLYDKIKEDSYMTLYDLAKPKLFTIWSFTGKVSQPTPALDRHMITKCLYHTGAPAIFTEE